MNSSTAFFRPKSEGLVSTVLSRLWSLVSATGDRDGIGLADPRPYSFLAECECPDDCLRDHENE